MQNKSRTDLLIEFYSSPNETLFDQLTLCAVLNCSTALAERNRWRGDGCPFIKIGRVVRYRKSDILAWLEHFQPTTSTSVASAATANTIEVFSLSASTVPSTALPRKNPSRASTSAANPNIGGTMPCSN
jgi:hypothetical protein